MAGLEKEMTEHESSSGRGERWWRTRTTSVVIENGRTWKWWRKRWWTGGRGEGAGEAGGGNGEMEKVVSLVVEAQWEESQMKEKQVKKVNRLMRWVNIGDERMRLIEGNIMGNLNTTSHRR
jgi:hypothetical protein